MEGVSKSTSRLTTASLTSGFQDIRYIGYIWQAVAESLPRDEVLVKPFVEVLGENFHKLTKKEIYTIPLADIDSALEHLELVRVHRAPNSALLRGPLGDLVRTVVDIRGLVSPTLDECLDAWVHLESTQFVTKARRPSAGGNGTGRRHDHGQMTTSEAHGPGGGASLNNAAPGAGAEVHGARDTHESSEGGIALHSRCCRRRLRNPFPVTRCS